MCDLCWPKEDRDTSEPDDVSTLTQIVLNSDLSDIFLPLNFDCNPHYSSWNVLLDPIDALTTSVYVSSTL